MSGHVINTEHAKICKNCEFSVLGRNPSERACFNISGIRLTLFGPRFVKCTNTCSKFALSKKYAERQR